MIRLRNITKSYRIGNQTLRVLRGVSADIYESEFVAITGASGSGKSTLLQIMGLLDTPDSGEYSIDNRAMQGQSLDLAAAYRSELIGFIFQQFHLLPRSTALQNVELPLIYASGDKAGNAADLLTKVGLRERMTHRPNELSGGQQQRVAIARSLINNPKLILADEPTGNLDSKSRDDVLNILLGLHAEKKTLVIVTHEPYIAELADRVIKFEDGLIISDKKNKKVKSAYLRAGITPVSGEFTKLKKSTLNTYLEYLRQAAGTLLSNKIRTFLSALGIMIGVAAVIAVFAMGEGARKDIEKQLSAMGSNLLVVRPGSFRSGGVAQQAGVVTRFTLDDADVIKKNIKAVTRVSPTVNGRVQAVFGNKNTNTEVTGAGTGYDKMRSYTPFVGRYFTESENRERARVALIGLTIVRELFGDTSPLGKTIRLNKVAFEVIGVLPEKGANSWRDQDNLIIVPVQTAMRRLFNKEYVDTIDVEVTSPDEMQDVEAEIERIIMARHRIIEAHRDSFQIRNMAEIQAAITETNKTLSTVFVVIAGISLFVGGIGIMNIMLVSVKERTREIGLRKAIGAKNRDILYQFLIESVLIGFTGGMLGILIGMGASYLLTFLAGWQTEISGSSVMISILFSGLVGIVFGLWPAQTAAQLNPITALRYE